MRSFPRTFLVVVVLFSLVVTAGAQTTPEDGRYYVDELKVSILEVLQENQALFNIADGDVKDEDLEPDAFYYRSYDLFTEIAGEDFAVSDLGHDPEAIAQALGTMLQAGRITTAKSQKAMNSEPDGSVVLKKFIPAVFGRLVADRFMQKTGVQIKQTTLGKNNYGARNEYNTPDAWESAALTTVAGADWPRNKGYGEKVDGLYRLAKPIYIKKACLGCHGTPIGEPGPYGHHREGYEVGDVRGAISVTLPIDEASIQ